MVAHHMRVKVRFVGGRLGILSGLLGYILDTYCGTHMGWGGTVSVSKQLLDISR